MTGTAAPSTTTGPTYFTRHDIATMSARAFSINVPFSVVALGHYRGELRRAIHAMKFRNRRWMTFAFGLHVAQAVQSHDHVWLPELVTWAPTTPRRMRLRGHDQSALLAAAVARGLRVRRVRTLRRVDDRAQTGASRRERLCGPQFVARCNAVRGRRVLLVDDVMTTGTTLQRARTALCAAGAIEVRCAVIACVKAQVSSRVD
jgi:ComF family protein